jgi:ribonucleoside-diphosphate reductase alpha chain
LPGYREANSGLLTDAPKGGEDSESETRPAAKKAGGQSVGTGLPKSQPSTTNGTSHAKQNSNGTSAGAQKNGSAQANGHESGAALLERAGIAPKMEYAAGTPKIRSEQFASFQTDAPSCDNCGAITVRNGNCYLCHNCGNSMGCS